MTRQSAQASGVVKVRLSRAVEDLEVVAEILTGDPIAGVEVLDRSAPYPNHRDPGQRVYLTLRITDPEGGQQ